jgi:MerR family transcriptional regulator, light-induced transcriptional regulator
VNGAILFRALELPMQDGQYAISDRRAESVQGGASDLAAKIVAKLAARETNADPVYLETIVQRLTEAVQLDNATLIEALKPDMRRARISPAMLADIYIPEAARRLGKAWEDDTLTFADVTIGTVRLQSILRDISADWASDARKTASLGGSVLLLLPEREHHTLGPLVVTSQLRRRGVSVCLQLATADGEWQAMLRKRHFDGVIISVGWEGKLAAAAQLVETIKNLTKGKMPVAVGGAVLTRSDAILTCDGADIVTNDLDRALEILGLSANASRAHEGA